MVIYSNELSVLFISADLEFVLIKQVKNKQSTNISLIYFIYEREIMK